MSTLLSKSSKRLSCAWNNRKFSSSRFEIARSTQFLTAVKTLSANVATTTTLCLPSLPRVDARGECLNIVLGVREIAPGYAGKAEGALHELLRDPLVDVRISPDAEHARGVWRDQVKARCGLSALDVDDALTECIASIAEGHQANVLDRIDTSMRIRSAT